MTIRRDESAAHHPVAVVDNPVIVQEHREAVSHEGETVTRRPDGYTLARAWMRTLNMVVGFFLLLLETVLVFRLAFKLGGANADNGFVNFIYGLSSPFIAPFKGIANHSTSGSNSIFEPETVIAMAVWAVAAILLVVLVNIVTSAPAPAEHESVSRERYTHVDRQS